MPPEEAMQRSLYAHTMHIQYPKPTVAMNSAGDIGVERVSPAATDAHESTGHCR
jgi:hypothetical protein